MTGVVLIDPKHAANVGGALRACAIFGVDELAWTGARVTNERREHDRGWRDTRLH